MALLYVAACALLLLLHGTVILFTAHRLHACTHSVVSERPLSQAGTITFGLLALSRFRCNPCLTAFADFLRLQERAQLGQGSGMYLGNSGMLDVHNGRDLLHGQLFDVI